MKYIIRSTIGALLAGTFAAGCSTTPTASEVAAADAAIGNAGQAVDQAAANPDVAKYATSELERATGSLDKAKAVWGDKHDVEATTHFAYLAQQRATTAQELANKRASENAVKIASLQRDRAMSAVAAQRAANPPASAGPAAAGAPEHVQSLAALEFAFGKATLPAKAKPMIDGLASTLKSNAESVVVIEGHTDNVGSPGYNQELAMARAVAVRNALMRRGVDGSRIAIRAYGEQNPMASNDNSAGRRENRRAQVMIADTDTRMTGSSKASGATSSGK